MQGRAISLGVGIAIMFGSVPFTGFSQVQQAQTRIPQQIVINGQLVNGAHVTGAVGQLQSFSCATPQHYTTADSSSQGWACYEQSTGVWLLNAVAPAQAQPAAPAPLPQVVQPALQQPTVIYQQAPPPAMVYQQPPPATVIYQQPPPATVIYQQPPTVIYQQPAPTVVYAPAPRPVVVAPAYPASVVLGEAAIYAAGRVAAAAIAHHSREYNYYYYDYDDHRRHDRGRGRRW